MRGQYTLWSRHTALQHLAIGPRSLLVTVPCLAAVPCTPVLHGVTFSKVKALTPLTVEAMKRAPRSANPGWDPLPLRTAQYTGKRADVN